VVENNFFSSSWSDMHGGGHLNLRDHTGVTSSWCHVRHTRIDQQISWQHNPIILCLSPAYSNARPFGSRGIWWPYREGLMSTTLMKMVCVHNDVYLFLSILCTTHLLSNHSHHFSSNIFPWVFAVGTEKKPYTTCTGWPPALWWQDEPVDP